MEKDAETKLNHYSYSVPAKIRKELERGLEWLSGKIM